MALQLQESKTPMTHLNLDIDRNSPVPLHHQVAQSFEEAIIEGRLAPGHRVESEMVLSTRLRLSRPTVRQAMDSLVRRGLLVRKRGIGTQVVDGPLRRPVKLTSLHEDLRAVGLDPTTVVTSFAWEVPKAEIAEGLGSAADLKVCHFTRIRAVDGKPLALMENWVSSTIKGLSAEALETDSLYDVLQRAGVNLRVASQSIGAATADSAQAALLNIRPGAALVTMRRTASDDTGRVIEIGRHVYRADSYTFDMTLVGA
ncbi:GntR family transcriptional regulator [Arthrobacter sp. NPDC093125]|uniref:GntR family transcriptional regulator n=1 Tax=Arthrobacter sp. NPDC093125 TaxID=3363944 RepID=UPI0037FBB1DF